MKTLLLQNSKDLKKRKKQLPREKLRGPELNKKTADLDTF
jgi:hypothetical protein